VIPFGDRHLRRTIAEFVKHYHRERNHQGLDNELIKGAPAVAARVGRSRRRQRLGGLCGGVAGAVRLFFSMPRAMPSFDGVPVFG
jgi:hypothetical protein